MKEINRRGFLRLAGTGSLAAAVTLPTLASAPRLTATSAQGTFTFRAITGLPAHPLPSYSTYVIDGHVDLTTRSGVMTKALFAGSPQATSNVALPGLSRIMRITDVQEHSGIFRIVGVVNDRSQLDMGESATFELVLDPAQRLARTSTMLLRLEE